MSCIVYQTLMDGTGGAIQHFYSIVGMREWNALIEYSTVEVLSTTVWYNERCCGSKMFHMHGMDLEVIGRVSSKYTADLEDDAVTKYRNTLM